MTLLELVVALTITGAALAAGYGAFAGVVDRREAVTVATDSVARAAGVRRMLVAWVGGARVEVGGDGPDFRGLDGVAGTAADDELTFSTDARTPLGDVATLVRVFVDRDPRTPERGLTATLAEWGGTAATRIELAPDVEGLDVRYGSRVFGRIRWLPSWISRSVLPRAVEITLSPTAGDTLPALLALPITVLVGDGR
jgi:type II secretory pathway pseudopilin PulG